MTILSRAMNRFCAFGAGLSMALVFLIIFVNAVRRYLVGRSVPWGEELPVYLAIYGVMFGLALAYLSDRHIRFAVISDMLSEGVRRKLFAAIDLVTAGAGVALVFSGIEFASRRPDRDASGITALADWLAQSTGIVALEWLGRVGPYQAAIAFGGALLAVAALVKFAERLGVAR